MKVNLADLTNLVKRGRQGVVDLQLQAEIEAIDPNEVGAGFIYPDAQGDPSDDDFLNHKNTWRNRVAKASDAVQRETSVLWTTEGEMVVTLKAKKVKGKRK
jgi:hypothetical protein